MLSNFAFNFNLRPSNQGKFGNMFGPVATHLKTEKTAARTVDYNKVGRGAG